MTQREKVLTTGMLGMFAVLGGGFLFHLFVYDPVNTVRTQLEAQRDELQKKKNALAGKEKQIGAIFQVNPRLTQWPQLSLPPRDPELKKAGLPPEEQKRKHLANLRVAYEGYLSGLMEKAGFRRDSIKVEVRAATRVPVQVKGKEPPYEQLTFGATGQGKMDAVARLMREFYQTPLLHHVRNVSLGLATDNKGVKGAKKPDGLLDLSLTIDALLVAGGEDRTDLRPKALIVTPKVLAFDPKKPDSGGRNYLAMDRRNMFTGYEPTTAPVVRAEPAVPKVSSAERKEILQFVRLTTLEEDRDRKRWVASLYDQGKGGPEKKLNTGVLNEFTITGTGDRPMIEAKVVKIDSEFLVFLSEGKYYRMRCGETLWPAIDSPMTKAELKQMDITPEESEKEK